MNSICLSTDSLPVLGLDVAKKSVQAELRSSSNKVRFGFANNAKGFAQLACVLKEHNVPKVWAEAWKPPDPTAMPLRCGSMAQAIG